MADLTVTITEAVTLNNALRGSTNQITTTSVVDVLERILTCAHSNTTTIAVFNSTPHGAAGALDVENAKYVRVTNLDSSNAVELAVVGAATLYQVKLAAGQSHVLGSADDLMLSEADTSPRFGTMADLGSIQVNPGGNAVDVELFIASA